MAETQQVTRGMLYRGSIASVAGAVVVSIRGCACPSCFWWPSGRLEVVAILGKEFVEFSHARPGSFEAAPW